jgi:hypothetical protein
MPYIKSDLHSDDDKEGQVIDDYLGGSYLG